MRNPVSGLARQRLRPIAPRWPDGDPVRIRDDRTASILFLGQLVMVCAAVGILMIFGFARVAVSISSVGMMIGGLVTWRMHRIARRGTRSDLSGSFVD